MTRGDKVTLTLEAARRFADIGTREGTIVAVNADIVVIRWRGLSATSYLKRELVEIAHQ